MQFVTLTPFVLFSFATTFILAAAGSGPERWASLLLTGLLVVTPMIERLAWWCVPLSSLVVFVGLLVLALRSDRWWLLFACGCQMLALSTHVVTLIRLSDLMWSAVSIRWLCWLILMLIALAGAWEGRAMRRLRAATS